MWPYLLMLVFIFTPCLIIKKPSKRWLIYVWIILSLVEGFRAFSIGSDTSAYVRLFENQYYLHEEVGFVLFSKIIFYITDNPVIYLLIIALIINGLVLYAIFKLSANPKISVLSYISLYLYFNSFNATRQYISISLILIVYCFLKENKLIKALLFEMLAISFHNSAILGLLLVPCYFNFMRCEKKEHNKLFSFTLPFLLIAVLYSSFDIMMSNILNIFPQYNIYEGTSYFTGTQAIQQKIVYTTIFCAYVFLCSKTEWYILLSYTVCFSFLMSKMLMFNRCIWYFDVFTIFAIADIWNTKKLSKKSLIILKTIIIILSLTFLIYYLSSNVMRVTPYDISI